MFMINLIEEYIVTKTSTKQDNKKNKESYAIIFKELIEL